MKDKIEQLREWGHLVSIGVMILAMFAFGIHIERHEVESADAAKGDIHVRVNWEEVPAILIVFVLAEFGVILVAAAMEVGASVKLAGAEAEKAAVNTKNAAEQIMGVTEVGSAANDALGQLKSSLNQLSYSSKENIWEATGQLMSYCGLTHQECWESLANYTRSWIPDRAGKDQGTPVGFLFKSFAGTSGGIRRGRNEVACTTTDSAFMEASQKWLTEILSRNEGGIKVYAVTTLLPTEFAIPHLWWERNGKPYRVQVLDNFVNGVLETCNRNDVEYKRVTVFNSKKTKLPEARTLNADSEDIERFVNSVDLKRSLDEWFILDERLSAPNLRTFTSLVGRALVECDDLVGDWLNSELRWSKIREDLRIPEKTSTKKNWDSHTLPESFGTDYASFSFQEGSRRLLYFSERALAKSLEFSIDDINPSLAERRDKIAQARGDQGNLEQILKAFGYLSLREWYCESMHQPGGGGSARYWEADDEKRLEGLSIDWDEEQIPTLDLLLIGERVRDRWLGAAIANLQMETPSCLVKMVTGTEELERIAETAEALVSAGKPWTEFGK